MSGEVVNFHELEQKIDKEDLDLTKTLDEFQFAQEAFLGMADEYLDKGDKFVEEVMGGCVRMMAERFDEATEYMCIDKANDPYAAITAVQTFQYSAHMRFMEAVNELTGEDTILGQGYPTIDKIIRDYSDPDALDHIDLEEWRKNEVENYGTFLDQDFDDLIAHVDEIHGPVQESV